MSDRTTQFQIGVAWQHASPREVQAAVMPTEITRGKTSHESVLRDKSCTHLRARSRTHSTLNSRKPYGQKSRASY